MVRDLLSQRPAGNLEEGAGLHHRSPWKSLEGGWVVWLLPGVSKELAQNCWLQGGDGVKGQLQKRSGRNWQRLACQRTHCPCPENLKYSSSLSNKWLNSALEMFVIKLSMSLENIYVFSFDF